MFILNLTKIYYRKRRVRLTNNLLLIDSDYDEASEFINGLKETTKKEWEVGLFVNNKVYGIRRYIKFFWVALKVLINKKKYSGKTILCWQQFYGIAIAFFCRLFHLKKDFTLVVMTFIFKEKKGKLGRIFFEFVKYSITSKYVDKIILTTRSEAEMYSKLFNIPVSRFAFSKCGAIEYNPDDFYDEKLVNDDYLFSTGRSNRDYNFLIDSLKGTEYNLVIACDNIPKASEKNIEIRDDIFGHDMLRYMRNAKAVIISLDNDKIAAGQLVLLHAMNMGVPVIVTKSKGVTDDYVLNGYNGLIIEKKSESLLNALDLIYSDVELYEIIKKNSINEFKNNYTYYASGKNVGNILNTMSKKKMILKS